jgi:hypothetical protein
MRSTLVLLIAATAGAVALVALEPDPPPIACEPVAHLVVCVYPDGTVTSGPEEDDQH